MAEININKVVSKLDAIVDRRLRAFILADILISSSKEEITEFLEEIINLALRDDEKSKEILFSFIDLVEGTFSFEFEDTLNKLILDIETSNRTLKFILFPPSPHRFLKRGEVHVTDIMMDYLPLGVKRSFAKKMDKNLIRRMLSEKDPFVIKHLLANPLITEKDVLKIASSRPNQAEVIKVVYASEKWVKNYKVKEALIKNPYSPFRIALLLLFSMCKKELVQIRDDETLHPELRLEAERMIKLRR